MQGTRALQTVSKVTCRTAGLISRPPDGLQKRLPSVAGSMRAQAAHLCNSGRLIHHPLRSVQPRVQAAGLGVHQDEDDLQDHGADSHRLHTTVQDGDQAPQQLPQQARYLQVQESSLQRGQEERALTGSQLQGRPVSVTLSPCPVGRQLAHPAGWEARHQDGLLYGSP